MKRSMRQGYLAFTIALMTVLSIVFLTTLDRTRDEKRPEELEALAAWLAEHPADWLAASALTAQSLDSPGPRRRELWRMAYAHAQRLSPRRANADAAFVRGGLFHWAELQPADRREVLAVAGTLMKSSEEVFVSMHRSLWELTHDIRYLRSVAPHGIEAASLLRDLAVTNGEFAHYRQLRELVRGERARAIEARRRSPNPGDLLALLPDRLDKGDEAAVRLVLEHLEHIAFDPSQISGRIEEVARFAVDHDLQPLSALSSLIDARTLSAPTRARVALALGQAAAAARIETANSVPGAKEWLDYYLDRAAYEAHRGNPDLAAAYRTRAEAARGTTTWSGTCAPDEICASAVRRHDGELPLTVSVVQTDEVPPYVEVYVDDALAAEGEVRDTRRFVVGEAGTRRIEVRLVNRRTRNGFQRRVRLS